ncbi:MAG: phytanoyl-CoA dioxygenase family protein [Armatimonadetes bacterium]|nr:phytanoyl-CoA dioxygenase family protein [Armatimonadota bacterium]
MEQAHIATARGQYNEDGFYVVPQVVFPKEMVANAVAGMDAIRRGEYDTGIAPRPSPWNPGDDLNQLCKIEQPQFANHAIRELLTYPALGEWASAITGASGVQLWWVQLLYKPTTPEGASLKTNVGWHQDRHYWGVWEEGSELFTAWIALSDVEEDCGPMQFVRGSHKWGFRNEGDFFAQNLAAQREGISTPVGETWEEVSGAIPAGGVTFHHNLTFHGSQANVSGRPRRSFAVHLRTQNSRPIGDRREGLSEFIDDRTLCPVIYGKM